MGHFLSIVFPRSRSTLVLVTLAHVLAVHQGILVKRLRLVPGVGFQNEFGQHGDSIQIDGHPVTQQLPPTAPGRGGTTACRRAQDGSSVNTVPIHAFWSGRLGPEFQILLGLLTQSLYVEPSVPLSLRDQSTSAMSTTDSRLPIGGVPLRPRRHDS